MFQVVQKIRAAVKVRVVVQRFRAALEDAEDHRNQQNEDVDAVHRQFFFK